MKNVFNSNIIVQPKILTSVKKKAKILTWLIDEVRVWEMRLEN